MRILGNKILFKFVQQVTGGKFQSATDWNFQLKSNVEDVKYARWGKVVAAGPEVTDVSPGEYVLIEPLMWTNHFELEDGKTWGTNRDKVIAVSKSEPTGLI